MRYPSVGLGIEDIKDWMSLNRLMINPSKTDVLFCSTNHQHPELPQEKETVTAVYGDKNL